MRQSHRADHRPSVQSAGLRPQELVQLNVLKGMKETLVSKELMGRAAIPLRPFTDKAGEPVDMWVDLGKGEWANEDGTVRPKPRIPYLTKIHISTYDPGKGKLRTARCAQKAQIPYSTKSLIK